MDDVPVPIREMITAFAQGVRAALADNLTALYVFGSLRVGDFDAVSSDIDFLAVIEEPLSEGQVAELEALHRGLARASVWGHRLEGGYALRRDLRPWGIAGPLAVVAPGAPLRAGAPSDYSADNMLAIRQHGLALHGPTPETLLPPVDRATLAGGLHAYLAELLTRPVATAPAEEIAARILNIARCLYGLHTGSLSTKRQAVRWLGERASGLRPVLETAYRMRSGETAADGEDHLRSGFAAIRRVADRCRLIGGSVFDDVPAGGTGTC